MKRNHSLVIVVTGILVAVLTGSCGGPTVGSPGSDRALGSTTVGELQRMVDEAAAASGAVGVQVSVILGDERADLVSGTANTELEIPMAMDTVVQIGSATKVLNTAMILTLVDEGTLDLDVPVKTYIPDLDIADDDAERTITLRQLLSMTSGLDNGPYTPHGGGEDALARYVASLGEIPQAFPPGEGFGYSNAGTAIAGRAAERVTGEIWDALLKSRILDPAGLNHAVTRAQELPFQRVSVGHTPGHDGEPPAVIRPWYINQAQGPAGSTLAMSAHDLASFGDLFVRGGEAGNGNRVLSERAVETMATPVVEVPSRGFTESWCVGLEREHWDGTPVYGHAGGNMSGTSYLKIFPEKRGVLAITCNTPAAFGVFAEKVFDGFGPAVFGVRRSKLTAPDPPLTVDDPDRYVGTYTMEGATYEVIRAGDALKMSVTTHNPMTGDVTLEYTLTASGDDDFLTVSEEAPAETPSVFGDVGFFGDDGHGRATNLVAPVFAARRIE